MRLRPIPLVVLYAVISLLFFPAAPASACRAAITFDEAVAAAEYIVIGQVGPAGDPYWFEEPGEAQSSPFWRAIITPLDVTVVESLKGSAVAGDTLRIGQLGGQIGDVGMICSAEQYLGSGDYLLFLSSGQGPWAQTGLRVGEAWSFAGDTLAGNLYWPEHTKMSKLRADIEGALRRDAGLTPSRLSESGDGAGAEATGLTSDGDPTSEVGRTPLDPGVVVVAGLLGGSAVGAVRVRRARR